jgi:hypothetical protein
MLTLKYRDYMNLRAILLLLLVSSCTYEYHFSSPPKIIQHPADLWVLKGDTNSSNCLSVIATHPEDEIITYQWYMASENDETPGIEIQGATLDAFVPDKSNIDTAFYFVVVSSPGYAVGSNVARVFVVDSLEK